MTTDLNKKIDAGTLKRLIDETARETEFDIWLVSQSHYLHLLRFGSALFSCINDELKKGINHD